MTRFREHRLEAALAELPLDIAAQRSTFSLFARRRVQPNERDRGMGTSATAQRRSMEIRTQHGARVNTDAMECEEQRLASKYVHPNDTVLELGARYGSVSCTINSILSRKDHQVSVEPDDRVWDALEANRDRNGCGFHIVKGFLSSKKWALTNLESC